MKCKRNGTLIEREEIEVHLSNQVKEEVCCG